MKKQLRCILLLALCIIGLCLVPVTANAKGENVIELTQDNYRGFLKTGSYNKSYLPTGSYKLMGDITLDETCSLVMMGSFMMTTSLM